MSAKDPNIGKGMSEDEYLLGLPDDIKKVVCKRKPAHINEWCCRDTTLLVCETSKTTSTKIETSEQDTTIFIVLFGMMFLFLIWLSLVELNRVS